MKISIKKTELSYGAGQSLYMASMSGLFWAAWAVGCYLTVFLQGRGFTASMLGTLNAICCGVAIAATSMWGVVSDKIGSVKKVELILLLGMAILYSLVPFVQNVFGDALWPYFILMGVCCIFKNPVSTFHENLLVRNCNELRLNYGLIRSVGSLVFAIVSTLVAKYLYQIGVGNTFWLCGLCMIPIIVMTVFAREPQGNVSSGRNKASKQKIDLKPLLGNRTYILFIVFAVLYYSAVNFEGNYIPYFMEEMGIDTARYGTLLALRAVFEMPFLILMVKLRGRFSLRGLIIFSPILMGVECLAYSFFVRNWTSMMLFSGLFGLGNGLFIGTSLNYLYEIAPEGLKASAQAFFTVASQIAGILSCFIGGFLYDWMGSRNFYFLAAVMFMVATLVFLLSGNRKKEEMKGV